MSIAIKNREIKKILKSSYPKTKFSVTKRWSDSSHISWVDGPTEKDIKSITTKYCRIWTDRRVSEDIKTITKEYVSNTYSNVSEVEVDRIAYDLYSKYYIDENYSKEFLVEEAKKQSIKQEKEYQEYLVKREIEDAKNRRRENRRILAREKFDSYEKEVTYLEDETNIVTTAKFANLNKNQNIKQYEDEVNKDKYFTPKCIVKRIVEFKDLYAWLYFKNNLLDNYDFCHEFGGSKLLDSDPRANEINDEINYNEELLNYFKYSAYEIVIEVKYKNENEKLYVNPQGYSYPRYVGI